MTDEDPYWTDETPTPESDAAPDTAIVPYVNALHDAGVETRQSCAGHETAGDGKPAYGVLDFESETFDPHDLVGHREFARVARMYEPAECWRVTFFGMMWGEEHLRDAMAALFGALGVGR